MTRRERLESKVERRREWAEKAASRSDARFKTADTMASVIPLGQPLLPGHHSYKRDLSYRNRIQGNLSKGIADAKLADHHQAKASGLAAQLDESIFSDDTAAIGALEARIEEREAEIAAMKAINKAWKKGGAVEVAKVCGVDAAEAAAKRVASFHWLDKPYDTTNERASVRRDRERIEDIKRRQTRATEAEAAPGGVAIVELGETCGTRYVRVTFADKPEREVLDMLKAAGFRWGAGSWVGDRARLPDCVRVAGTGE